jgi:hypothetical protein
MPPSITDPATLERAAARVKHVRTVVDSFPPLTPEQRDRIAALLHTPSNRGAARHDERNNRWNEIASGRRRCI